MVVSLSCIAMPPVPCLTKSVVFCVFWCTNLFVLHFVFCVPCAVFRRGDDDIDTVSNGGWYWPIESRKLPSETLASKPPCEGEEPPPREGEDYNVEVVRVKPQRPTASLPRPQTRTQVIYRTRYVPIPEKTVVEKAVYVPVYDDPFWNPRADGEISVHSTSIIGSAHFPLCPPLTRS